MSDLPRPLSRDDLLNRFAYHQPHTPARAETHDIVRGECFSLAKRLVALCPPGRELSLAITHLEDVMMWSNAAIARQLD